MLEKDSNHPVKTRWWWWRRTSRKEEDSALALQHVCYATLNSEGNFSLLQFYKTHTWFFFSFLAPNWRKKQADTVDDEKEEDEEESDDEEEKNEEEEQKIENKE